MFSLFLSVWHNNNGALVTFPDLELITQHSTNSQFLAHKISFMTCEAFKGGMRHKLEFCETHFSLGQSCPWVY